MFAICLVIAAAAAAVDQLIKLAVVKNIPLYETRDFIPGLLGLTHIRNSGAAWSIMEGKTWFLIGIPLILTAAATVYCYINRKGSRLSNIAVALVLGGGIGNLIDRIRMKEVVDYLKTLPFDFPVFNFADMCVVVGAVLFCISTIFLEKSENSDNIESESKNTDGNGDADGRV